MQKLKKQLSTALGEKVFYSEKMEHHTTIKIGGNAEIFIAASEPSDIIEILKIARENYINTTIIGNGSNLLVSDLGIDGVVLKIYSSQTSPKVEDNSLTVFSGYPLGKLINFATSKGLAGLEGLVGIPGTVGGAVCMNAGAQFGEIADIIDWVKVVDKEQMEVKTLKPEQMDFSYRKSIFQDGRYVILETSFKLTTSSPLKVKAIKQEILKNRNNKQPIQFPNSGSVFKNPPGNSAGRLIEDCGLKGYSIGDAQISTQHANFIVNKGKAKATHVMELINLARTTVYREYNITLEPEVKLVGGGLKLEEV